MVVLFQEKAQLDANTYSTLTHVPPDLFSSVLSKMHNEHQLELLKALITHIDSLGILADPGDL